MATPGKLRRRRRPLGRFTRFAQNGTQNVLEAMRLSRLTASGASPYEIVDRDAVHRLRRYARATVSGGPEAALLLVPPLMLTAEIYDISADLSAIAPLAAAGVDCWIVDFGSPQQEEGGMSRTLDDHIRTVAKAVRTVRRITGRDVHLAGYSQGGMFAYQGAALLRSEAIASLITFGSPVDVHRNVPFVHGDGLAGIVLRGARSMIDGPLKHIEGLPGILTSTAFKLLTPRKEVEQMIDLVIRLWDRQDLEKRAARRKFLGGEGFVAWPGPALRDFVDELVVQNRMMAGGIIVDGRTLALSDIKCPILTVLGLRDEIALPAAVRGIRHAAPDAEVFELGVEAGHFGIVVGSRALRETWPSVLEWVKWREGKGPLPALLVQEPNPVAEEEEWEQGSDSWDFSVQLDHELVLDAIRSTLGTAAARLSEVVADASANAGSLRWQVPKLRRLERLLGQTRISFSYELARRAAKTPDATFFLWSGRAFSYRSADDRVTRVTTGLFHRGVTGGARVGIVMLGRPSLLTAVCALNRMGAVGVVAPPGASDDALARALHAENVSTVIADPENAARVQRLFPRVLVLGGAGSGSARALPPGTIDMEAIDTAAMPLPQGFVPDVGAAHEQSMVLLTQSARDELHASPVTNHRWAFSALGAAAACTLTPRDTVYVCLPLHHPAGLLVAVSSALAAGARLALGSDFSPATFFPEVRRYGATIVFYAGDMLRDLVAQPPSPSDRSHPLRLFAGSGMRADLAREVRARFGVGVLEIYASTSHHVVMVNASGKKPGAVGRPLPGTAEVVLARWDFTKGELVRDARGLAIRCAPNEPGATLVRLDARHNDDPRMDPARIFTRVIESGDRFYALRDVLSRDDDGDHFFIGTLTDTFVRKEGLVFPRAVEDALYRVPGVERAVAQRVDDKLVATVQTAAALDPSMLTRVLGELAPHTRPDVVREVRALAVSTGFRVLPPVLHEDDLTTRKGVRVSVRSGKGKYVTQR